MTTITMMCAWCRKTRRGDKWIAESPEPSGDVSHGICPGCYDLLNGEPFERWMLTGLDEVDYFEIEEAFVFGQGVAREMFCYECGCRHLASDACPRCGTDFDRGRGRNNSWHEDCWLL